MSGLTSSLKLEKAEKKVEIVLNKVIKRVTQAYAILGLGISKVSSEITHYK